MQLGKQLLIRDYNYCSLQIQFLIRNYHYSVKIVSELDKAFVISSETVAVPKGAIPINYFQFICENLPLSVD